MITVTLSHNASDNRALNKRLVGTGLIYSCQLYDDCSIIEPKIKLAWSAYSPTYNYMYIAEWNRYYYIKSSAITGGAWEITGLVDPLMSFKTQIENLPAVCVRESRLNQRGSARSTWIEDNKLPVTTGRTLKIVELPNTVLDIGTSADNKFILAVAGGGTITPGPTPEPEPGGE